MNKKIKSTAMLFTAAIIWGFAFVAQCMVDTDKLGNFSFNGIRFALGAISLIPIIMIFEKEEKNPEKLKKTVISATVAGIALFAAAGLQQLGISINHNAGKAGFITGLYTVLVPILGCIIWKRKTYINTWIAAVLAATGLFLLSASNGISSIDSGDIVVLIGSFFWAVHILVIDSSVNFVSPIKFSCIQFFVCSALNLIIALFTESITWSGITSATIPILYTGIMSVGVAYTCQVVGQKDADPNFAAIVLSSECVFSAIGGAIILHEKMPWQGYLGCVLIFAGIVLSQLKSKENAK